jgi:hypothetical protein
MDMSGDVEKKWSSRAVIEVLKTSRRVPGQSLEARALRVAAELVIRNYALGGHEYQDTISHEVRHIEEERGDGWMTILDTRVREILGVSR